MTSELFELLSFFFAGLSFVGAIYNSNLSIWGFYIWLVSNGFSAMFDYHFNHWGYFWLHLAFLATNVNGIYKHRKAHLDRNLV